MALADIEEEIAYEESRLHIHIVGDRKEYFIKLTNSTRNV
jgi:hypothetical protein